MIAFEWRFRVARLGYRVYGYHEKITKYEKAAHWEKVRICWTGNLVA